MKNMIDRYLYDVSRRLPESIRADVERELRSNIEDMLPEDPGEGEIEKVLTELGSPAKLAVKYNPRPRYLISPELFDDYVMVLKVVAVTLAALLAGLAVFKIIFGDAGSAGVVTAVVSVIASFLSGAFNGIVQAFFWVTVVFFCIEYFGGIKELRTWSPKNLPEVPANVKSVIKRSESVADAVFSILFSALFLVGTLRHHQFIAWYEAGAPAVPLFDEQLVLRFLPLFIFLMAMTLFVAVIKLIKGRWCVSVAVSKSLHGVFSTVIGAVFINRPHVFTDAFIARFAGKVGITETAMAGYFKTAITVVTVLMIVGTVADIATTIGKTSRSYK
jgi:hypothetical protein